MINYYIKYYELIDTVFLVLKKKPLGTLSYSFLNKLVHGLTYFSPVQTLCVFGWIKPSCTCSTTLPPLSSASPSWREQRPSNGS